MDIEHANPPAASAEEMPAAAAEQRGAGPRLLESLANSIGMRFVHLRPGTYLRGSPPSERGRDAHEGPQHEVLLTRGFWLAQTEVTQAQWQAVMGDNPSNFRGPDLPVERVTWEEAVEFCERLGALPAERGRAYRLPTEAEWEYACRAGSADAYCFGEDAARLADYAWFEGNSHGTTHPVGRKRANAWTLLDMHGNVWEWCADHFGAYAADALRDPQGPTDGEDRVLRGGCWNFDGRLCRCAYRRRHAPSVRGGSNGLRPAMTVTVE